MINASYTTRQISHICHVTVPTVAHWVDNGDLKAFKTLGGHRRVLLTNLIIFLEKFDFPVPKELLTAKEERILIIDDDPKILKSLSNIIKKSNKNYKIFTASNGFEAGQSISRIKPDLVILDLMLPGIDGFEVCKLIRQYEKKIKIIAITGFDTKENRSKIIAAGANFYYKKPLNNQKLLKTINNIFRRDLIKTT